MGWAVILQVRGKTISPGTYPLLQIPKDLISQDKLEVEQGPEFELGCDLDSEVELNRVQVPKGTYVAIQHNAAVAKDFKCLIPKLVVVMVEINDHPARALIDTGSLADFMSTNLAEQLDMLRIELAKPLTVQLAVQGSRSKVNHGMKVTLKYQEINSEQYFDITNLQNYDLILGTPFLFQHKVMVGLNESCIIIGSHEPVPIRGSQVQVLESRAADVLEEKVELVCKQLYRLAKPLCAKASETSLPPL